MSRPLDTCRSCGEQHWTWQPADHPKGPVMAWHQVLLANGERGDECPGSCKPPAKKVSA